MILRGAFLTREIEDIAYYISQENPDAAERFVTACECAFQHLDEFPQAGVAADFTRPKLRKVRFWPITGFEHYLIFYLPIRDGVEILHVVHGARDYHGLL